MKHPIRNASQYWLLCSQVVHVISVLPLIDGIPKNMRRGFLAVHRSFSGCCFLYVVLFGIVGGGINNLLYLFPCATVWYSLWSGYGC